MKVLITLRAAGSLRRVKPAQHPPVSVSSSANPDDTTQEPSEICQTRDTEKSGALVIYFEGPDRNLCLVSCRNLTQILFEGLYEGCDG